MNTGYKYVPLTKTQPVVITSKVTGASHNFNKPHDYTTNNSNIVHKQALYDISRDDKYKHLIQLINRNKTKADNESTKPSEIVTKSDMLIKTRFTDEYLKLIDEVLKDIFAKLQIENEKNTTNKKSDEQLKKEMTEDFVFLSPHIHNAFIKQCDAYKWETIWDTTYYASNTLYFLFLANIYYNLLHYIEQYYWLEHYIGAMERGDPPLTGMFKFMKTSKTDLFEDKIPFSNNDEIQKYINEKVDAVESEMILSHSGLSKLIKYIRENYGGSSSSFAGQSQKQQAEIKEQMEDLKICYYGDNCKRNNREHISEFHPERIRQSAYPISHSRSKRKAEQSDPSDPSGQVYPAKKGYRHGGKKTRKYHSSKKHSSKKHSSKKHSSKYHRSKRHSSKKHRSKNPIKRK